MERFVLAAFELRFQTKAVYEFLANIKRGVRYCFQTILHEQLHSITLDGASFPSIQPKLVAVIVDCYLILFHKKHFWCNQIF